MNYQRKRVAKRLASGLLAGALALGGLAISGGTASATSAVTATTRVFGADRYGTAVKLSGLAAATKIVLVNGENFADGLAASSLAGALSAEILLTKSSGLPDSVLAHITTITGGAGAGDVIVLVGGTSAIPTATETQLTALGYTVIRFAGADRYATADAVAAATVSNNGGTIGTFGGYRTAILASGSNFADALAISGWAYSKKHPIFLTNGSSVSAATKAAIVAAGAQQILILGGTSAVSDAVKSEVGALAGVITTTRVGGADRYETATLLATAISAVDADFKAKAFLVDGRSFPDALAVAQYAGDAGAIIPVTEPMPASVAAWFAANKATMATIEAIGGTSAVSDSSVTQAAAAATIGGLSATISAADGSATATVVLSDNVDAATVSAAGADFVVTSILGAARAVTAAYTAKTATAPANIVLTLGAGVFAPGDKISLAAAAISAVGDATLFVAPTSVTVVPDTTVPTASITAYPGAANAQDKVWVTFSANTDLTEVDIAGDSADFLVTKGSGAIGATAAVITGCARVGTTTTYKCDLKNTDALVAGDVVTLLAGAVDSTASTPVLNAATSTVVGADAVAPVLQSAKYSMSATGGTQASVKLVELKTGAAAAAGEVTITARAGTAAAGKAGNTYKVAVVNGGGAIACAYSAATKTVTVTITAATDTANAVANACNTSADVSALFIATASGAALTGADNVAATAMSGGLDVLSIALTFSEPLSAAVAADFTISADITGQGASKAITAVAATDAGRLTGALTLTVTTNATPLPGVSTVTVANTVLDRNGNAVVVTTPPATHIVGLFAA